MNNLKLDKEAGQKKNLISLTKKLSEVNKKMFKNKASGRKDFNKKTPEFK